MGFGGGSASGKTDYPDYMKTFHGLVLDGAGVDTPSMSLVDAFNVAVAGNSPYYNYLTETDPIGNPFGTATSASGTKVYELLQVFTGLNYDAVYSSYVTGVDLASLTAAVSTTLDDEITINVLPKFKANLRGIGAVQASAYAVGEALIWDSKVKALAKERVNLEELVLRNKDFALRKLLGYLELKRAVTTVSADIGKVFYSLKADLQDHYSSMHEKDLKWDLEMFQYLNAGLASISGAAIGQGGKAPSKVGSAIGGALSGAAMGAMVGGPVGAGIGGALGLAGALMS